MQNWIWDGAECFFERGAGALDPATLGNYQPIQPPLLQESFGEDDDVSAAEVLFVDKLDFLEPCRQSSGVGLRWR